MNLSSCCYIKTIKNQNGLIIDLRICVLISFIKIVFEIVEYLSTPYELYIAISHAVKFDAPSVYCLHSPARIYLYIVRSVQYYDNYYHVIMILFLILS